MASYLDVSDFTDEESETQSESDSSFEPNKYKSQDDSDENAVIDESNEDSTNILRQSTGAVRKSSSRMTRRSSKKQSTLPKLDSFDSSQDNSILNEKSAAFTSYRDSFVETKKKTRRKAIIDSDSESTDDDRPDLSLENKAEENRKADIVDNDNHSRISSDSDKETQLDNFNLNETKPRYTDVFQPTNNKFLNSTFHTPLKEDRRRSKSPITPTTNTLMSPSQVEDVTKLLSASKIKTDLSSVILLSPKEDVIDVSSGEEYEAPTPHRLLKTPSKKIDKALNRTKQLTLNEFVAKKIVPEKVKENTPPKETAGVPEDNKEANESDEKQSNEKIEVSPSELKIQQNNVLKLKMDVMKGVNMMKSINIKALPDGGKLLINRQQNLEERLNAEIRKLANMVVTKDDPPSNIQQAKTLNWEDIQAGANAVMPKTFGKQAMSTYNAQKALTIDRLQQLHGSLATRPKEDECAEDPKGLKVELMPHQKRALAWLMFREKQKPSGGILADDMGLGKTLTMISLMLKTKELEDHGDSSEDGENNPDRKDFKHSGGTLVICPASLINQWSNELERRTKRGLASFELYHGPKREKSAKILSEYDMVITTYSIANNEADKKGAIYRVKWRRIILDEAHQIRNHKSQTSEAVCRLAAKSRWALTGTPIHNKELDMYALLKFLRCSPFDDLQVWKRWVGDKSTGGTERLHTVISSLMLRRTKTELMEKGSLQCLPNKKWELIPVELHKTEMAVYQKVLIFSRTLFAQFLHQRAEKNTDMIMERQKFTEMPRNAPNDEYAKMRSKLLKFNKVKDVSQHEILVLLLRLRQICNHPTLITSMLDEDGNQDLGSDEELEEINLLDQLNKLNIDDNQDHYTNNSFEGIAQQEENAMTLKDASKGFLNPSNPVFSVDRLSSKIATVINVLKEKVLHTNDKAIIVSQWTSFLRIIARHLKNEGIHFDQLDGSVPVHKRMAMVDTFNNPRESLRVLLLSLTAGGVGLNLVGANHLFLLDLHWNPQLENQAQDRIYRMGQKKPVFVYKFMATDTIEERIKALQQNKLDMAEAMLTGSKQAIQSKLSLQDLRMLFDM